MAARGPPGARQGPLRGRRAPAQAGGLPRARAAGGGREFRQVLPDDSPTQSTSGSGSCLAGESIF